jgi:hypothetical protein
MLETSRSSNQQKPGSDRNFGMVFFAAFFVIALWPAVWGGSARLWAVPVAVVFGVVALVKPGLLRPLNQIWFRFGLLLHAIVSPIALGLVFALTVVPIGFMIRLLRKDVLSLTPHAEPSSYWISRDKKSSTPDSMRNQF